MSRVSSYGALLQAQRWQGYLCRIVCGSSGITGWLYSGGPCISAFPAHMEGVWGMSMSPQVTRLLTPSSPCS